MKSLLFFALVFVSFFTSCVQKTHDRPTQFILDVSSLDSVQSVGLRGSNSPLSWSEDLVMKELVKDSLYTVDVTFNTGYLGVEYKFTVNGEFEFQDQDNRRSAFEIGKDTTIIKCKFNQ